MHTRNKGPLHNPESLSNQRPTKKVPRRKVVERLPEESEEDENRTRACQTVGAGASTQDCN